MRLAFPAAKSFGLWELTDLNEAESVAEAEEGCRLIYVAASRAEDRLILSGHLQAGTTSSRVDAAEDQATRRCAGCCRRSRRRPAGRAGRRSSPCPGRGPIGSPDRLGDAALEISVSEPSPERAAELVRRSDPPPEPEPLAGTVSPAAAGRRPADAGPGRAPLLLRAGPVRALRLPLLRRAGARRAGDRRRRSRRRRRGRPGAADEDDLGDPEVPRNRALGVGNAVHAALEWSAAARLGGTARTSCRPPARPRGPRR